MQETAQRCHPENYKIMFIKVLKLVITETAENGILNIGFIFLFACFSCLKVKTMVTLLFHNSRMKDSSDHRNHCKSPLFGGVVELLHNFTLVTL